MKKLFALLERIAVAVESLVEIKRHENGSSYTAGPFVTDRNRAENIVRDVGLRYGAGPTGRVS